MILWAEDMGYFMHSFLLDADGIYMHMIIYFKRFGKLLVWIEEAKSSFYMVTDVRLIQ